jgi:RIO kinase 1
LIDDLILDEEEEAEEADPLAPFFAEGLITDILGEVKSGKEGTVYCCRAAPSTGLSLVAAKVYRPRGQRNFKNDAIYREGIVIRNGHDRRAVKRKSEWGREFEFGSWLAHEHEVLTLLCEAGADVPRPIRLAGNALLMEYIGDANGAAPCLQHVRLADSEARPLFERVLGNIELFLRLDWVHGDLSPYNILYHRGRVTVIDFPQAVDPRANRNAPDLLARDLENVCRYFGRYGVLSNPARMSQHLWNRFLHAEL